MLAVLLSLALLPAPHVAGPVTTPDTTPTYRLSGGTRFQCAVDGARFTRCRSPWTPALALGRHVLRVRSLDGRGRAGRAKTLTVTIVPPPPRAQKAVDVGGTPFGVTLAGGALWDGNVDTGAVSRSDRGGGPRGRDLRHRRGVALGPRERRSAGERRRRRSGDERRRNARCGLGRELRAQRGGAARHRDADSRRRRPRGPDVRVRRALDGEQGLPRPELPVPRPGLGDARGS